MRQPLLSRRNERAALLVQEVDLAVQGLGVNVRHLANAPEWRLVHQQREDDFVLVRLFVSGGGFADSEGLAARLAAVAPGPGTGSPKPLVGARCVVHGHPMVGARWDRAGRPRSRLNNLQQTIALFDNPRIALERRELAAHPAVENWNGGGDAKDVAVLHATVGGATAAKIKL